MNCPVWKPILVAKIVQVIVMTEYFSVQSFVLDLRNWTEVVI